METQELVNEIKELEELIRDYETEGFKVNEYLLAKLEILKLQSNLAK
jgi:hypothetical protein